MIVSKSADYGLRAMVHLARNRGPRLISLVDISTAMRTPPALQSRIMQRLVRAKLAVSMRGHHGGFGLQREPSKITAADIVRAIDGPFRMFKCTGTAACGLSGDCTMVEMFARAEKALNEALGAVTLHDLASHARLQELAASPGGEQVAMEDRFAEA